MPEKPAGSSENQTIRLSWPPSQNALWRAFRGRNILSVAGREWYVTAASELMAQRAVKMTGPVEIEVELAAPTKRRYDPDNKIKAIFDSLVKSAIIEDDSNLIVRRYSVIVRDGGFQGARVTIRGLGHEEQDT